MRVCFLTTLFVAGLALCFADVASAQGGRGRGGGGGRGGNDMMGLLRLGACSSKLGA